MFLYCLPSRKSTRLWSKRKWRPQSSWSMTEILPFIPLGIVGSITWSLWAVRRFYGATYKPFQESFTSTTSVVVPVYMEDPEVLLQAIGSYLANKVGEVILVVDHKDTLNIESIQKKFPGTSFPNVKLIVTKEPGKRPALARGIMEATGDIVILSDSDTSWAENLLEEILKPFADPEVAGVSARQNVESNKESMIWRIENWLLDIRYMDFIPGMSVDGVVNCLSGRTAAYRRSLLLPVLDELTGETFLGKACIGGDDVRLTHLMLVRGYKTVYQSTALAKTVYSTSQHIPRNSDPIYSRARSPCDAISRVDSPRDPDDSTRDRPQLSPPLGHFINQRPVDQGIKPLETSTRRPVACGYHHISNAIRNVSREDLFPNHNE